MKHGVFLAIHSAYGHGVAVFLCLLLAMPVWAIVMDEVAVELIDAIRSNDIARIEATLAASGEAAAHMAVGPGITPLHIAAALDLRTVANLLVTVGADVNARTQGGFTPLHWAASRNATGTAEMLLESGADIQAVTANGITPLHWAANNNATNIVGLLIARGAEVLPETAHGQTPLHWAVITKSRGAAVALAFQAVSEEMDAEATAVGEAAAETAETDGPAPEETPPPPPEEIVPVEHLPRPVFGRSLVVPIGFGEKLSFAWVEKLRLWVGTYEVTNGQFRRFKPKHKSMFHDGFSLNGNDQPAVYVSWHNAMAYCKWLNRNYIDRTPRGCSFRLPTDDEWQAVAQCGDNRLYPWGNRWPPKYGNFSDLAARTAFTNWEGIRHYDDGYAVTCPVSDSGSNEWGIYGLAGNVWEWCSDWYDAGRTYKIRRGGCWDFDGEASLRVDARGFDRPEARYDTVGFRLFVSRKGPPMVRTAQTR